MAFNTTNARDQARRAFTDPSMRRPLLMFGVPGFILLVIAIVWLFSGRYQSTDNAYVKADMVLVSPDVGGRIVQVFVKQNELVKKGQPIVQINPVTYKLALEQSEAMLLAAAANVKSLQAKYKMTQAQLELAGGNIDYYQKQFQRQDTLAKRSFASQSNLDTARHNLNTAAELKEILRQNLEQIVASLDGKPDAPVEEHSIYQEAKAQRDAAFVAHNSTFVKAPFDGVVGKQPQLGDNVAPGAPIVSVVSQENVWVEANFKETQLTNVRAGQKATISIDTYPGEEWEGRVVSIAQATGAEFSILPAQNATGNWVKVVQRIPVKVSIERREGDPPIRSGMSAEVEIDTKSGPED